MGVVLGRRANHGRTADIDILDTVIIARARGDRGFEGIEIDHDQVDRADLVFGHGGLIFGVIAAGEDAAVDRRVQGFDPTVHDLGEARMVGNFDHRDIGIGERAGGTAGGENLDIVAGKSLTEIGQSGFVGHGDDCARDLCV